MWTMEGGFNFSSGWGQELSVTASCKKPNIEQSFPLEIASFLRVDHHSWAGVIMLKAVASICIQRVSHLPRCSVLHPVALIPESCATWDLGPLSFMM